MKRRKIENNTGSASVSYSYNRRKLTYNVKSGCSKFRGGGVAAGRKAALIYYRTRNTMVVR